MSWRRHSSKTVLVDLIRTQHIVSHAPALLKLHQWLWLSSIITVTCCRMMLHAVNQKLQIPQAVEQNLKCSAKLSRNPWIVDSRAIRTTSLWVWRLSPLCVRILLILLIKSTLLSHIHDCTSLFSAGFLTGVCSDATFVSTARSNTGQGCRDGCWRERAQSFV